MGIQGVELADFESLRQSRENKQPTEEELKEWID